MRIAETGGFTGRITGKGNLQYFGAINHINPREAVLVLPLSTSG